MAQASTRLLDVQDMLCAQALAVVAQAVTDIAAGASVLIRYNSEDVKRDLRVWAAEQGHAGRDTPEGLLEIARRNTSGTWCRR